MTSLYVHVPFCQSKCAYCAFYSLPIAERTNRAGEHHPVDLYLTGIEAEIQHRAQGAPVGLFSLFIGGGTPSLLSPNQLERLLLAIQGGFSFAPDAEKTMEANPGTLTEEKLAICRRYGINRISLGVQSFDDKLLREIGRSHRKEESRAAIQLLRHGGFTNLNLDLMFGLPGQQLSHWQETLQEALVYEPQHLSLYALTLEEGTPLLERYDGHREGSEWSTLPEEDLVADMYDWAVDYLQSRGYERYEISNFAKPGYACRHNLGYWRGEDYLGIGPGAVSTLQGIRSKNLEDVKGYVQSVQRGGTACDQTASEVLTDRQQMAERMMLGLRTAEGVDLASFEEKFGRGVLDIYGQNLANYLDKGLLRLKDGWLRIAPNYLFVANSILEKLV